MRDLGFPMEGEEEEYIEQRWVLFPNKLHFFLIIIFTFLLIFFFRIFMKEKSAPLESEFWKKNYDPYEQDLFHFPDSFKAYQQQYKRYDEAKKFFEENPNAEATVLDREFKEPTDKRPWTRKF